MTQESNIVIPEVEESINEWLGSVFDPCMQRYRQANDVMEAEGSPIKAIPTVILSTSTYSAATDNIPF